MLTMKPEGSNVLREADFLLWGVETPNVSGLKCNRNALLSLAGEAQTYVQAQQLKACATLLTLGFPTPLPPEGYPLLDSI